jgi:TolB protein
MSRPLKPIGALILLVLAAGAAPLAQEEPRIRGEITEKGYVAIRIAVPYSQADAGAEDASAQIVETLRADLEFSGFFDLVDPSLYRLASGAEPGDVDFEGWAALGAQWMVVSRVKIERDRVDLQAWAYDVDTRDEQAEGLQLFARRYGGKPEMARRIAHQLADDLVRQYTGRRGVALSRIAFVSRHEDANEIYLMDYDGHRIRRLTTTGTLNLNPVWSPDGSKMAFVSWREKAPNIYLMDNTGKIERLPAVEGELNASPDWSPDGKKLVYSSDFPGNQELYLLDLRSGRNTRLTRSRAIEISPDYAPNGREIAFTSDRSGSPQVYIMDVDGLNTRRTSFDSAYSDSAAWSPRGDKLAYVSRDRWGYFQVVVKDLAKDDVTKLTRGRWNSENPRWSPDGRHIVFSSNRFGTYDVYTMKADGTDVRRLSKGGDCRTPDWSH